MLTYADVYILTYADVYAIYPGMFLSFMLQSFNYKTYADVC
jgi:hypothetical protein